MPSWKISSNLPFGYHPSSCCFNSCRHGPQRTGRGSCCCTRGVHHYYDGQNGPSLLYQFDDSHCVSSLRISRGGSSTSSSKTFLSADADGSSSSSTIKNTSDNDLSQYHLVTSPNVPYQILLWTCLLYIMRRLLKKNTNIMNFFPLSSTSVTGNIYNYIVLPLLSSACCSIQLIVNAMFASVGCVGFNKVLGPLRPLFIAWLLLTTQNYITQILVVEQQGLLSSVVRISSFLFVTWTMALLPEIIHWRNNNRRAHQNASSCASASQSSTSSRLVNTNQQQRMEIEFSIPSMGCVACIQKVTNSLQQANSSDTFRIQEASSWLNGSDKKGGKAKVIVEVPPSSQDPEHVAQMLAQSVQENGFQDCQVDTIQQL